MQITEIIRKKRDGESLSEAELNFFVDGFTRGKIPDYQASALLMAIFINRLSVDETFWLLQAMLNSGEVVDLSMIPGIKVDKHSTGGVGDKTSLTLAPVCAAAGVPVPMISGRGLGHTGGTLDKFDSIPGYNTQPDLEKFKKIVKEVGCAIIGQTSNLAPADKKLYSIRDVVGTVESLPLITSSILSKKIASGLQSLVLDVKVGNGSFNSTIDIARDLSRSLVSVAKGAGLKCEAILTDMNQVLGKSAGHTLEMLECIKFIKNENKDSRLEKITYELICALLMMVYKISKDQALQKINEVISNGLAAEKFEIMVKALGGPANILTSYEKDLKFNAVKNDIFIEKKGWLEKIQTRQLGLILIELGGGRKQVSDKINFSVGYDNVASIGDKIDPSKPILTLYSQSKEDYENVKIKIQDCFIISENESKKIPEIYEIIN